MLRSTLLFGACCSILLVPLIAGADLQTRKERSRRTPIATSIVRVEVDAGRLFIGGENLPAGSGVKVLLGGESLEVIRSGRSLVVARLPSTRPERVDELVVEGGVRRAVVRGRHLDWGLRWAPPTRQTRIGPGSLIGLFGGSRSDR